VATASVASATVIAQIEVVAQDATTGSVIGSHTWTTTVAPNGSYSWGVTNGTNPNAWVLNPSDPSESPRVEGVSFSWQHDPAVNANFNVTAGVSNTTFTVNSTFLSFGTINPATALASAAVGVTDSATFGDVGTITLVGLEPGGNLYTARFNSDSGTFVNLIPGSTVGVAPGGSTSFSGNNASFPGYDPLPGGTASDMDSQFKFTLSRFDRATGTSTYEITPAPGAAALIGLAGLFAGRRRRA
jgi:uncharacterized protein (TIGR03382 family)